LPRPYISIVIARSFFFWIGVRLLVLMVVALSAYAGLMPSTVRLEPADLVGPQPLSLPLTAALILIDTRAAGEDVLLANFGVSRTQTALAASMAPAAMEFLLVGLAMVIG
jgi:hypothetical protein